MSKFKVLRQHRGDRMYMPGDVRTADDATVAHLVRGGVLQKMLEEPSNKKAPEAANKASSHPSSTRRAGSQIGEGKQSSSSPAGRASKISRSTTSKGAAE